MKEIIYFAHKMHSHTGNILYFNLLAMLVIGLIEGASIFLLVPLISVTGIIEMETDVSFLSWLSDLFQGFSNNMGLLLVLSCYVLFIVGQSFFKRNQTILSMKIQQAFTRKLREETFQSLLQADWAYYLKTRKTDIVNIMTQELTKISGGTYLFLQFLASLVITFVQIVLAFWLSAQMTGFVLFFGLLLIFLSRKFIFKSKNIGKDAFHLHKTYLAGVTDQLNGIKDIKSNHLEASNFNWFQSMCGKIEDNFVALAKVNATSQFIYKSVSAILIACFAYFFIKLFQAQTVQLILIVVIFSRIWPQFTSVQSKLEQLGSILPSFQALMQLQRECKRAKEVNIDKCNIENRLNIKSALECKDVFFKYDSSKESYALKNINLSIPVNTLTAIVGRSGAGKSTLIDLLMGLNQPVSGSVLTDGTALTREQFFALRNSIGYVPQDPFLFNGSIKENMLMMSPHAKESDIWNALEFSSAAKFVKGLPQGMDTMIGDRGIKLSGGERQRIVLARAILRKPAILILDEATSALDSVNEAKIQEAIDRLKGNMTIIVIAHRLSTIRNADQVIVLDRGEIIQSGGYSQLSRERQGLFNTLIGKQFEVSL